MIQNDREGKIMFLGAVLGCVVSSVVWLGNVGVSEEVNHVLVETKAQNEWNSYENAYCIKAGMKSVMEAGRIVCHPDNGKRTMTEFWETSLGEEVIREKLRQQGYVPHGLVNWPGDFPENENPPIQSYKKPEFKPANPESFETKSKVTE